MWRNDGPTYRNGAARTGRAPLPAQRDLHHDNGAAGRRDRGASVVGGRGHLAVIGFLILAALNVGAFARVEQNTHAVEDARVERVRQINKVNVAQCASLRNLYGVIRKTLRDGDEAIDNIQYYRDHPGELAEA